MAANDKHKTSWIVRYRDNGNTVSETTGGRLYKDARQLYAVISTHRESARRSVHSWYRTKREADQVATRLRQGRSPQTGRQLFIHSQSPWLRVTVKKAQRHELESDRQRRLAKERAEKETKKAAAVKVRAKARRQQKKKKSAPLLGFLGLG